MDGDWLTPEELRYLMLTSTCLEQFISRKFFQDRVDILDPNFIQKVEVGIADTILENYKKIKNSMIRKRKEYFRKKNLIYQHGMNLKKIKSLGGNQSDM